MDEGRKDHGGLVAKGASPMVVGYAAVKAANPGFIVFYRVGEFYEVLMGDAAKVSRALGVQLTRRKQKDSADVPMCGIPASGAPTAVARLLAAGFKVLLSEQPTEAGGPRPVRLMTPGTTVDDDVLPGRAANNILMIHAQGVGASYAWLDLSTGEVGLCSASLQGSSAVLSRVAPSEIAVSAWPANSTLLADAVRASGAPFSDAPGALDAEAAEVAIGDCYGQDWREGLRGSSPGEVAALANLLSYVSSITGSVPSNLCLPRRSVSSDVMEIDQATLRGLEVFTSPSGLEGALVSVMDRTVTAPGARLLLRQLAAPLTNTATIARRLAMVGALLEAPALREACRDILGGLPDMPRAAGRLSLGKGGPRDLAAVRDGIAACAKLASILSVDGVPRALSPLVRDLALAAEGSCRATASELASALSDSLPKSADEGGFVRFGVDAKLDACRAAAEEAKAGVEALQARYAAAVGVKALRIRTNSVIGYHIEVPNSAAEAMRRSEFTLRQGLASSARYATGELDKLAIRIGESEAQGLLLERRVFDRFSSSVVEARGLLQRLANSAAALDMVCGLAQAAAEGLWVRPDVVDGTDMEIVGGRHPVADAKFGLEGRTFVENDCMMGDDARLWLMTGPNMSGKSTFLRQTALIALMAQVGSYVPAEACRIGVVDKMFSRIGASDDLAAGRSTFMVEMVETAAILSQATDRSLVILDEVGRGTSTYDGLSIAQACMEDLHDRIGCRTLFATHYHELADAADAMPHAACMAMDAEPGRHGSHFSHKVRPGRAGRSYGLKVAEMAGMPSSVVSRAAEILSAYTVSDPGPDAQTSSARCG